MHVELIKRQVIERGQQAKVLWFNPIVQCSSSSAYRAVANADMVQDRIDFKSDSFTMTGTLVGFFHSNPPVGQRVSPNARQPSPRRRYGDEPNQKALTHLEEMRSRRRGMNRLDRFGAWRAGGSAGYHAGSGVGPVPWNCGSIGWRVSVSVQIAPSSASTPATAKSR
jgi:hypothetical protein